MSLLKKMVEEGLLDGSPILGEAREAVDKLLSFEQKDDWRGDGKDLTFVMVKGVTYVYDFDGFLCSTRSMEGIMLLLLLTDTRTGAREALFPSPQGEPPAPASKLDAHFSELSALQQRAKALASGMQERRSLGPAGSSDFEVGDGTGFRSQDGQQVRIVGLEDGPPEF